MSVKTQKSFTLEVLKNSEAYKTWINEDKVVKIHDTYHDDPMDYAAYIVIIKDEGKYTITRFFIMSDKVQVSVDHSNITAEEVFDLLLSDYSSGLK